MDKLDEIEQNLFTVDESYSLAHCVAEDLKLSRGIAIEFKCRFNGIEQLRKENPKVGQCDKITPQTDLFLFISSVDGITRIIITPSSNKSSRST